MSQPYWIFLIGGLPINNNSIRKPTSNNQRMVKLIIIYDSEDAVIKFVE